MLRMFSSMPGLCTPVAFASPPTVVTIKNVSRHCQMSPGEGECKTTPSGTTAPAAQLASGTLRGVPWKHKARGWALSQKGSWLLQPEGISPGCFPSSCGWSDTPQGKPSCLLQAGTSYHPPPPAPATKATVSLFLGKEGAASSSASATSNSCSSFPHRSSRDPW